MRGVPTPGRPQLVASGLPLRGHDKCHSEPGVTACSRRPITSLIPTKLIIPVPGMFYVSPKKQVPLHVPGVSTRAASSAASPSHVAPLLLALPWDKSTSQPNTRDPLASLHHLRESKREMLNTVDMAKTHEIMARFRPIAPKPQLMQRPLVEATACQSSLQLRARPCRTRKRGRVGFAPVPAKRQKTIPTILPSANSSHAIVLGQLGLSAQGFNHGCPVLPKPSTSHGDLPTLSLLPCSSSRPSPLAGVEEKEKEKEVPVEGDLLTLSLLPCSSSGPPQRPAVEEKQKSVPVERDLSHELQKPKVIVPQPMRPVGSSISVACISENSSGATAMLLVTKRPEEVEAEVEAEALPTVVSDSNNKVRLANAAYKEMVGQPECSWLDSMVGVGIGGVLGLKPVSRRINGDVMLDISGLSPVPMESNGFSCRAKIEWKRNGRKTAIDVPCTATRLYCESKDYLFAWRFNTTSVPVTGCKA